MFLSKVWFILVALVASVSLTVAFVAPRSAHRQLASVEAQGLDRAQYAADQMLKTDATRWINRVAKIGRDAILTEALESATRDGGEARTLNETVRGRLGTLVPAPDEIGIKVLGAVDGLGRVVGRIGEGENEYGESVAGIEVVADALRGYLSDDVWGTGGHLRRVAAAPVLAKTRDRVVGAVFVAVETGDRLAEIWKKNLDVDVALLLKGEVVSSTLPAGALGQLAGEIASRQTEIDESHRTRAFTLPHGHERLLAVAAPFPGEAAALGAHYVLLDKQHGAVSPFALLASSTKADVSFVNFPWLGLSLAMIGMLGVGLFLQRREIDAPLARLRRDLQRLLRGEINKLDDSQHPGRFGGIARDVNASLERGGGLDPTSEAAKKDLNAILGDRGQIELPPLPPLGGPASALGMSGFGPSKTPGDKGASSSGLGAVPAGRLSSPSFPAQPSGNFSAPGTGPGAFPSSLVTPAGSGPFSGGGSTPVGAGFGVTASVTPISGPPSLMTSQPAASMARPAPAPAGKSSGHSQPLAVAPAPTRAAPAGYQATARAALAPEITPTPVTASGRGAAPIVAQDDSPTADMKREAAAAADAQEKADARAEEKHVREVFAEYVETRARCGESTKGLTLDKFREKLDSNRKTLVEKFNCRTARFAVYVKDGKAAIKATPVRE
jgi:hypothetical protein